MKPKESSIKAVKKTAEKCLLLFFLLLSSCSYNPFAPKENVTTGSLAGTAIGAATGAGIGALANFSKAGILVTSIGGGAVGYYVTTLRYDSAGLIQGGGQVYVVGQKVGIVIPTDNLFEPNSADFLPQAEPILNSAAVILQRYPQNNILISGNMSGFSRQKWEQKLSQERAKKVAAYFWNVGIYSKNQDMRRLNYVGNGDFFPIASSVTNTGIRSNSRIQITSYPSQTELLQSDSCHSIKRKRGLLG